MTWFLNKVVKNMGLSAYMPFKFYARLLENDND